MINAVAINAARTFKKKKIVSTCGLRTKGKFCTASPIISESGVIVTSKSDAAVQLRTLPHLFHMIAMLSSE